jgi:hypothetical protein
MALITVVATYLARETYRHDLGESRREPTGRFVRKPAEERETTAVS